MAISQYEDRLQQQHRIFIAAIFFSHPIYHTRPSFSSLVLIVVTQIRGRIQYGSVLFSPFPTRYGTSLAFVTSRGGVQPFLPSSTRTELHVIWCWSVRGTYTRRRRM